MPCYYPIRAWRSADFSSIGKTGKLPLVFRQDQGLPNTEIEIACGRCIGCRLDKARQWAIRILFESTLYDQNCFITLTYNDDNLPEGGSLNKRDIQLFFKRLRKAFPNQSIRYFQCGEYGDLLSRPHHHAIIFNFDFEDKVPFKRSGEYQLYVSKTLAKLWPYGIHSIGNLTFDSACYTARYILKKITGDNADEHYQGRLPEFVTMSRRPGIGKEWFELFSKDLYNHDVCVVSDDFIARPPKYFDTLYDLTDSDHLKILKKRRMKRAKDNPDNKYDRLEIRRKVAEIKQERIRRQYETNGTT